VKFGDRVKCKDKYHITKWDRDTGLVVAERGGCSTDHVTVYWIAFKLLTVEAINDLELQHSGW
jgi:hypothetical protein